MGSRHGRRRQHKRHKRVCTIRRGLYANFDRAYYSPHEAKTYLSQRGKDRAFFCVTDWALSGCGRADWRLCAAFFGGKLSDWASPGFALRLFRPLFKALAKERVA
jgi:hypothetical protein